MYKHFRHFQPVLKRVDFLYIWKYYTKSLTTDRYLLNSEKEEFWKGQFRKGNFKKDNYEKETTGNTYFWKGNIRKKTILHRKHLKQENSEKDKSEMEKLWQRTSEKGQYLTGRIWNKTALERKHLKKNKYEKEESE